MNTNNAIYFERLWQMEKQMNKFQQPLDNLILSTNKVYKMLV